MRKFIVALILLGSILFVIGSLSEMEAILATLQQGDWRFISLAIVLVGIWLLNVSMSYQSIFRALGIEEKLSVLLPLSASVFFVGIIAPSVGVSGIALLMAEARRRGFSPARAAVANALFIVFDNFGVLSLVAVGFLVLFRRNNLTVVEIAAAAFLLMAMIIIGTLMLLGIRSAQELGQALAWLTRVVNRAVQPFINRVYLSEEHALLFAHDVAEGLRDLRQNPRSLLVPALLALSNKLLLLGILTSVFLAFKVPISPGTVVAGLSISQLFTIVSPTPAGLGFVEGTLTLVLSGMYISIETAVVITLAYRGITFWIPLFYGMLAFQINSHRKVPQEVWEVTDPKMR